MYLHCKEGFVEADRWDGRMTSVEAHNEELRRLTRHGVVVVRARSRVVLEQMLPATAVIFSSPIGWDYEWRSYVTRATWAKTMVRVAMDLDYRNFKNWTHDNAEPESPLAHEIWNAAHDHARRR